MGMYDYFTSRTAADVFRDHAGGPVLVKTDTGPVVGILCPKCGSVVASDCDTCTDREAGPVEAE